MIKDIRYSGFAASPSDYECPDGQLVASVNAIVEDGALKPIPLPSAIGLSIDPDTQQLYIHSTAIYEHFIVITQSSGTLALQWTENVDGVFTLSDAFLTLTDETFVDIKAVGNVLVLSTDSQMHYIIWKADNEAYTYLGNRIPDVNIKFALKSNLVSKTYEDVGITTTSGSSTGDEAWENVSSVSYSEATNLATKFAFDSSVSLVANTEYRLKQNFSYSVRQCGKIYLYGTTDEAGSTTPVQIGWFTSSEWEFTPTSNYYNLYVMVEKTTSGSTASGVLVLSKGFTEVAVDTVIEYNEDNYNAVTGCINKFINDYATKKNRFIYPFFVRYAIKMYDGSYVNLSAPVLMIPNSGYAPWVYYQPTNDNLVLYAFIADLQYSVVNDIPDEWEDLIQGVDIFVSQPVYPYSQGESYDDSDQLFTYAVYNTDGSADQLSYADYTFGLPVNNGNPLASDYTMLSLFEALQSVYSFGSSSVASTWRIVKAAARDPEDIIDDFKAISNFYLVKDIKFDDFSASDSFSDIDIAGEVISTLVNRQTLSEDAVSYASFSGAHLHSYNNRLHVFGGDALYPGLQSPLSQNGYVAQGGLRAITVLDAYVYIKSEQGDRIVKTSFSESFSHSSSGLYWFFYPSSRAYKVVVRYVYSEYTTSTVFYYEFPLTAHDFLNGAYCFLDSFVNNENVNLYGTSLFLGGSNVSSADYDAITEKPYVSRQNIIYVSDADNPFVFTNASAVSVGADKVLALASAAKALSQGQFGQYPLYAFTNEGVWSLETATTGVYTARQPITRDVCLNIDSITQIDSTVLFVTARGIMMLSGSESTCISDELAGDACQPVTILPKYKALLSLAGITEDTISYIPFLDYIVQCRMLYDYTHQRIIVYNPGYGYAYVYSLKSKLWGLMQSTLAVSLNSYPDAYAINSEGNVVNVSASVSDDTTVTNGLIVTRPLKLDAPDVLKTVHTAIQRGTFRRRNVKCVIYASRDLFNWILLRSSADHCISSLSGTPYKYFRFALILSLQQDESIYGCSVEFTPKMQNRLR